MNSESKITVLGGYGLLGSAIVRRLKSQGFFNIDTPSRRNGLDLTNRSQLNDYLSSYNPDFIFMTAGIVGGIDANNKRQADFLYYNSLMILNLLDAVKSSNTKIKILYTGSTCIYPRENPQPINESRFMAGPLEETNKGYAVAKGMGVVAAEMFRRQYDINTICAMPTNLFGPNDNYDPDESHFLAAVIKKLYDAKYKNIIPVFWGSGNPRREALYSDDCADTCIHLMKNYNETGIVNIGTGFDYSIKEFIEIGKKVIGYNGEIKWDTSKPDGTYEKRTDISFLKSLMPEFNPRPFEDGLKEVLKIDFNVE